MAYRCVVLFDDEVILDETAEVGDWIGLEDERPYGIAIALTEYGQETHEDALLDKILNDFVAANPTEQQQKDALIRAHVSGRREPSITFSYNDPGPRKKDGSPVRTNIERPLPSTFQCPVSAFAGEDVKLIHLFQVIVEESVA